MNILTETHTQIFISTHIRIESKSVIFKLWSSRLSHHVEMW